MMREFKADAVKPGYFFSQPAYLDDGFVFLSQEMPFTVEFAGILREWHFTTVYSDGEPCAQYAGKTIEKQSPQLERNDAAKLAETESYIDSLEAFTGEVFRTIATGYDIKFGIVAAKVRDLCEKIKDDRRYLLQVQNKRHGSGAADAKNFNASHNVKSAIISLVIGIYLKMPAHRLIELGVAALMHEIGMVKLPAEVCLSRSKLNHIEMTLLKTHPIHGFEILKSNDFPMAVSVTALEHHERENGTGYPRKIRSENISLYSKIIAVACSYAAITANRPHQDARGGYEGITDLLRNTGKQYDDTCIRALVFSLSLYPIGQYVILSNNKKGQVIDVNPRDPRHPIVEVIGEKTPDGKNRILSTSPDDIHIIRPIDETDV